MPFNFKTLEIPEVILVEPKVFGDERGFFKEADIKFYYKEQAK